VGATDYKLGLSLGRGLLAVACFSRYFKGILDEPVLDKYTTYWRTVLQEEFNQGPEKIFPGEKIGDKYISGEKFYC